MIPAPELRYLALMGRKFLYPFTLTIAGVMLAAAATAAEKPRIGPVETWVQPDAVRPAPSPASAGAPIAPLSEDVQLRFDGAGQSRYVAYSAKAQTAQGLQALGTVTLAWAAATDQLTIHHVRIWRDGRAIDCLPKDGAFTVLRRERGLESEAVLDGVLTTVIQPEGLQTNDILDVAYTVRHEDPVVRGRVDAPVLGLDSAAVSRLRIRALWPKEMKVRWRAANGMSEPKLSTEGAFTVATVSAEELAPLPKPKGAPTRFQLGRELDFTSYPDWASVSADMAPLYEEAARLPAGSPLLAEARAIAAGPADPAKRASAALALVQDKVRYLALAIGDAGLKPAPADLTWSRRYGDCKGKTVLLLSLLRALNIKAEPVLVSTAFGDGLNERLPGLSSFNHVIVRATLEGRDYWLDGTRTGDTDVGRLETPSWGYVLPVRAANTQLIQLRPAPPKRPSAQAIIRIDASKGISLPAPTHAEAVFSGDGGRAIDLVLANLTPDQRNQYLLNYWSKTYDFVTVTSASAKYDASLGEERLIMDGTAKMDWRGGYEADGAVIGWKPDMRRDPGPHADAPVEVSLSTYETWSESILLPGKGAGFTVVGDEIDRRLAGYAFHRRARIEDGVFKLEASYRGLEPEIAYAQARADADAMAAMSRTTIRVKAPTSSQTQEERDQLIATSPKTAEEYQQRAKAFLDSQRFSDAFKDFDKLVALQPKSALALANRGLVRVYLDESAAARTDLDAAEKLDPKEPVIWRARGLLAARAENWAESAAAFSRSLELDPGNTYALSNRALAYIQLGDEDRATKDINDLPNGVLPEHSLTFLRASVAARKHDYLTLRRQVDLMRFEGKSTEEAAEMRVGWLRNAGDREGARAAADKAIAAKPTSELYILRAAVRQPNDEAGIHADIEAAYTLDPSNYDAIANLAAQKLKAKDSAGALQLVDKAVAQNPKFFNALYLRATVRYEVSHDPAQARRDFEAARTVAGEDFDAYNSLCWTQATHGLDLQAALQDCDRSIKLKPGVGASLDSRAFVLLRLDRTREALDAYNAALAVRPDIDSSLYGRSLAERRLGETAKADADLGAALKANPKIRDAFDGWGVTR